MNNFHRPHGGVQEADAPEEAVRSPFSDLAGRFANWMTGADRLPADATESLDDEPQPATVRTRSTVPTATTAAEPPSPSDGDESARFPLAPFGYNRTAVDDHVAKLEA